MQIEKRGRVYYARYYDQDGKRKRVSLGTDNRKLAQQAANRLQHQLWEQRHLGTLPPILWLEAAERYNRAHAQQSSASLNESNLALVEPHLRGVHLHELREFHFEPVRQALQERAWAPSTMNRLWTWLRATLNWAADQRLVRWPEGVPKVPKEKEPEQRVRYLTEDEVRRLVETLRASPRSEHVADWVELAVETGLRKSNACSLRWADIDMQRGTMTVDGTATKSSRTLHVPLSPQARAVIARQIGKHPEFVLTYRGEPFRAVNPRTLRRAAAEAGIDKHVTPHVMRHTFAMLHLQRGTPVKVIQALGGWSTPRSMDRYLALDEAAIRPWVEGGSIQAPASDAEPALGLVEVAK